MTDQMKEKETTVMEEENENVAEQEVSAEMNNEKDSNEVGVQEEQDEVSQLKQTIEELQNRLLRTQADFENFRKRTRVEKEELAKYATAKLVESLLPAIDNFERAIDSSKDSQNLDLFLQGVEMVYRQIEQVLTQEGLEKIEAVGQPFNPEIHQAVMQVETDEFDSGIVVEELQKGYKLKEKVIRPSMVKVNA
ncbi:MULTISPECIES: nucleotide exchange factor GrpE [Tepidibacillus]|nr:MULTISPECIES: nucleotide exchange factor GrpE [Tepidibacillus]GBF10125.1 heat shock protein GrpE [Tepidibacillus sp. HK-1]